MRVPLAPIVSRSSAANLHTALITLIDRWSSKDRGAFAYTPTYAKRLGSSTASITRALSALTRYGVLESETVRKGWQHYTLRRRKPDVVPFVDVSISAYKEIFEKLCPIFGYGPWRLYLLLLHMAGRKAVGYATTKELSGLLGVAQATVREWRAVLADGGMIIVLRRPGKRTLIAPLRQRVGDRDERNMLAAAIAVDFDAPLPLAPAIDGRDVYLVQVGDAANAPVKIGVATDVQQRLADLQTSSPYPLTLRAVFPGAGGAMEAWLHTRFAAYRLHGEWFDAARPAVATFLRAAADDPTAALRALTEETPPPKRPRAAPLEAAKAQQRATDPVRQTRSSSESTYPLEVIGPKQTAEGPTAQRNNKERAAAPASGLTAGRSGSESETPAVATLRRHGQVWRVAWCGRCDLGSRRLIDPDSGSLGDLCPDCGGIYENPPESAVGRFGHPWAPGKASRRGSGALRPVSGDAGGSGSGWKTAAKANPKGRC